MSKKKSLQEEASIRIPEEKNCDTTAESETIAPVSLVGLFRYATKREVGMVVVSMLASFGVGALMPLFSIIFGTLFTDFTTPGVDFSELGARYGLLFGYLAIGALFLGFVQIAGFSFVAERMVLRIRSLYLNAVLRQDIAWFDLKGNIMSSQIAERSVIIREGINEKLAQLFQFLATALVGTCVGFYYSWKLSLVALSAVPLIAFGGFLMAKTVRSQRGVVETSAYEVAGGIAEEAFQSIRTVTAFALQNRIQDNYARALAEAEKIGIKGKLFSGLAMGYFMFVYFCVYAMVFYVGALLIEKDKTKYVGIFPPSTAINLECYLGNVIDPTMAQQLQCYPTKDGSNFTFDTDVDICSCFACECGCTQTDLCLTGGDVVLVFFAIIIGGMALGQAAPAFSALKAAKDNAAHIYAVIEKVPSIEDGRGEDLEDCHGDIVFENVRFRYPSRKNDVVFENLNLTLRHNQTTALCGGSGSGKSTISALLQRFYDPEGGHITVNGKNLSDLNVASLRRWIGYVGQEPILFATTIRENIFFGCLEGHTPSEEDLISACKQANCYDFIMDLPDGFDTYVGERGSTMSGGQKQRIAIARALIRDPSILILDEATSALDNQSEKIVQEALNDLLQQKKRTTLVIAHRLTTIERSDKIVVLGEGGVLEEGTHASLLERDGHYVALLAAAQGGASKDEDKQDNNEDSSFANDLGSGRPASSSSIGVFNGSMEKELKGGSTIHPESGQPKPAKKRVGTSRLAQFLEGREFSLLVLGCLGAIGHGVMLPLFALLFSSLSNAFYQPTTDLVLQEVGKFSIYFVIFAFIAFAAIFAELYLFGFVGEKLTTRIRKQVFGAFLRQEVGFYDDPKNSVGALTAKLATDSALVKACLTDSVNMTVMNLATVVLGLTIAFTAGWQLSLVVITLVPLILAGGAAQKIKFSGLLKESDESMSKANQVLTESIAGIRTVTAFQLRKKVVKLYDTYLEEPNKVGKKMAYTTSLGVSLAQAMQFTSYSITFWYGAQLIEDNPSEYDFEVLMTVFFAIVMTAISLSNGSLLVPSILKARHALGSIWDILDRKSAIDPEDKSGRCEFVEPNEAASIGFKNISFKYPTRDAMVFEDFSLKIRAPPQGEKKGQVVAFIGMSGSGKSSLIKLVERFYDPLSGQVSLNGTSLTSLQVGFLRDYLSYVEQEPVLFRETIFNNIAYGLPENQVVPHDKLEDMVHQAAKGANCHDFIMEFPDKYDTIVGNENLSGGQKQRVAIARALIRKPKLLLLDEATAALDNISEQIVKKSFQDLVRSNGTTILVVAHRLTSIQDSDLICVFHLGKLVEKGTHQQLISKENGAYQKLYMSQTQE